MSDVDYTLVVGVDAKHLRQLRWTWRTWRYHKPSLLAHPMIAFYDRQSVQPGDVRRVIDHPHLTVVDWPPPDIEYPGDETSKWHHPQRYKMLSGFVYVPGLHCHTKYWLKLDTDVVAFEKDDWIDPKWFKNDPTIVAQKWTFTKPPEQIDILDAWVKKHERELPVLARQEPLKLHPKPGADRVGHARIISWCGFFHTGFTRYAAGMASSTCGAYQLPVPSQDGYLWYVAKRAGLVIERIQAKRYGFRWWSAEHNILRDSQEVIRGA